MLRWIISVPDENEIKPSAECKNTTDEILAKESLAKAEGTGVVIPSNIS